MIMEMVYVQDISTLDILDMGYVLYEDIDLCYIYKLLEDEKLNEDMLKLLKKISNFLFQRVKYWKESSDVDKRGVLRINDFIKQETYRFIYNKGFLNNENVQDFNNRTKIINKQKKLTMKIFTQDEFEKYKSNVEIFNDILNQNTPNLKGDSQS